MTLSKLGKGARDAKEVLYVGLIILTVAIILWGGSKVFTLFKSLGGDLNKLNPFRAPTPEEQTTINKELGAQTGTDSLTAASGTLEELTGAATPGMVYDSRKDDRSFFEKLYKPIPTYAYSPAVYTSRPMDVN